MAKSKTPKLLKTVDETLKALGGAKGLYKRYGIPKQSPSNWKAWGWIPAPWFHAFDMDLRARGYEAARSVFGFKSVPLDAAGARDAA